MERPCITPTELNSISSINFTHIVIAQDNLIFRKYIEDLDMTDKIKLVDPSGFMLDLSDNFESYYSLSSI